jgi:hypothetical protein
LDDAAPGAAAGSRGRGAAPAFQGQVC